MDLKTYLVTYPEALTYEKYLQSLISRYASAGVIQFNTETAHIWAGPFPGGYAAYHIADHSKIPDYKDRSISCAEAHSRWLDKNPGRIVDWPTREKPIRFYMCGNDDTSYSKFYATMEEALFELELILACQPLDFFKDMPDWVFTN